MPLISAFMRVGKYDEIKESFTKKQIKFGCAANWMHYKGEGGIADCLEAEFICSNILNIPMVFVKEDALSLPVLCLYMFKNIKKEIELTDSKVKDIQLSNFLSRMGYNYCDGGYLFITNIKQFIKELEQQIPIALQKNKNRFYKFSKDINKNSIIARSSVKYDIDNSLNFNINPYEALFHKRTKYDYQQEYRIVIQQHFKQAFLSKKYNYKLNELIVELPHLHEYAKICSAKEIDILRFSIENEGLKMLFFKSV